MMGHVMREKLMATRMKYLQTVVRNLRAEVSTNEMIVNPRLLHLFQAMEHHLREMEVAYVGRPQTTSMSSR